MTMEDNDWRLLTDDPAITQGGKDSSASDCGTNEAPRACGPVHVDADGVARTLPYSIGAYEKD